MNRLENGILNEAGIYIRTAKEVFSDTAHASRNRKYVERMFEKILQFDSQLRREHPELVNELDVIHERGTVTVFNAKFEDNYNKPISIHYDRELGLKYVVHNGKKLYYPRNMRSSSLNELYTSICIEQDSASPHRYLDKNEDLSNTILFDCGCAEANFTLDVIEQVKAAYLFEGDNKWADPIRATFSKWNQKIEFVQRLIGKGDNMLSLRTYIEEQIELGKLSFSDKIFIKMDIEGSEVDVIEDLLPILGNFLDVKLAVCVYHRESDEKRIRDILKDDYLCEVRNGHMLFLWEGKSEIDYPFFRHGVLRIKNRRYDK